MIDTVSNPSFMYLSQRLYHTHIYYFVYIQKLGHTAWSFQNKDKNLFPTPMLIERGRKTHTCLLISSSFSLTSTKEQWAQLHKNGLWVFQPMDGILVSTGSQNRTPQTGWLGRFYYCLAFWRLGSPRQRCWQSRFNSETSSLGLWAIHLTICSYGLFSGCLRGERVSSLVSLLMRAPIPPWGLYPHDLHLTPNYLPKTPFPSTITLESWELQQISFEGWLQKNSPITRWKYHSLLLDPRFPNLSPATGASPCSPALAKGHNEESARGSVERFPTKYKPPFIFPPSSSLEQLHEGMMNGATAAILWSRG